MVLTSHEIIPANEDMTLNNPAVKEFVEAKILKMMGNEEPQEHKKGRKKVEKEDNQSVEV